MKFSVGLFLALSAPAAALRAGSRVGNKLMKSAVRQLDQNAQDAGWISSYSIIFDSCHTLVQVADEANEDQGMIYNKNLVTFYLCPTETCGSHVKNCGKYVVGMEEFVDAWTEAKLEEKEWQCENIRENCYCDNANDDEVCENQCYTDAGMEDCIEYEGGEEFQIQEYIECRAVENQNNNNNNNGNAQQYQDANGNVYYYEEVFAGPYCASNGKSIHLGMFYDEFCSIKADDSMYASMNYYGKDLPFSATSKQSIVTAECMGCKEQDQDNNNNNNNNGDDAQDEDNVIQMCEEMYENAGKCEEKIETSNQYQYKNTQACDYINNILPRLEQNSKSVSSSAGSGGTASVVFAWLFAFTTLALGVYAFLLFRKLRRSKVNLSEQSGAGDMS